MSRRLDIPITPRLQQLAAEWERARAARPAIASAPPGFESVWDYPRPPAVEEVAVRARVLLGEACVADSERCLRVLETASPPTIYFPPDDVEQRLLQADEGSSFCEWKGRARYFSVTDGERISRRAAWCYPEPLPEYRVLRGYVSFYPGRVTACWYGDQKVSPQPGSFYGGWVTPNLVGPFKGEPGSEAW